jgi:hypothetical protein
MYFPFSRDTMGFKNRSVMLSDNDDEEYKCFENINIEEDGTKVLIQVMPLLWMS